jgi:hypothetical protein
MCWWRRRREYRCWAGGEDLGRKKMKPKTARRLRELGWIVLEVDELGRWR